MARRKRTHRPVDASRIDERHQREQFFFDAATVSELADYVERFDHPCCLCAPMVAAELARRGRTVRALDIDERFAWLPGFRRFDLYRPDWLGEEFDLILCDPPFFRVSLSQLFTAVRQLARFDFTQPLLLAWLQRRQSAILGTFAPFGLQPTGYRPTYRTVDTRDDKRAIELVGSPSLPPLA